MIKPECRSKECYVFTDTEGRRQTGYILLSHGTPIEEKDADNNYLMLMITTPDEDIVWWHSNGSEEPMPTKDITTETKAIESVVQYEPTGVEVGGGMLYRKPDGGTTWHASKIEELQSAMRGIKAHADALRQITSEYTP